MKILYLKLTNFAAIYVAMNGRKEVEIDFSKSTNRIILFIGDNGSGKTSILRELHPFAYSGSMDVRSGTSLILDSVDGYKEIHIEDGDTVYAIKHFYKNTKRGVIVKSFVMKNGEELNPNGNVTSFLETIKEELSLEPDYLKIMRLGSNVTNIIEMKSSERKNFTSDLLTDIEEYTRYFKKISDDVRIIKNSIKVVADKINKLNVIDETELGLSIDELNRLLDINMNTKTSLQKQMGTLEGIISTTIPEGLDVFNVTKKSMLIEKDGYEKELYLTNKALSELPLIILTSSIDNHVNSLNKLMINENALLDSTITHHKLYNEQLNDLYNEKDSMIIELKKNVSGVEYHQMKKLLDDLIVEYDDKYKRIKNYTTTLSKENLLNLLGVSQEILKISQDIQEFDNISIKEAVRLIESNTDTTEYVRRELNKIDQKILQTENMLKVDSVKKNVLVLFKHPGCTFNNCPYIHLHDMIFGESEKTETVEKLESKRDAIERIHGIVKNINYISLIIKANSGLISQSGLKYLSFSHILKNIKSGIPIFDERALTQSITESEEIEDVNQLKIKITELKTELSSVTATSDLTEHIEKKIIEIDRRILELEKSIFLLTNEMKTGKEKINRINSDIDTALLYKEYDTNRKSIESKLSELIQKISNMNITLKNMSSHISQLSDIDSKLSSVDNTISKINKELFELRFKQKEFIELNKERRLLVEEYEEKIDIRESVSSTKGIPLLYIQLYFKNNKNYVNELLSMYSDNFSIDDFEIDEDSFNIPYIKNNVRINDVVYASQGEKSFLSLALSFALITQSIDKYNILLLDEIDSTLDQKNRSIFLNILEKQIDTINAEQVFLITHNDMFDTYPVDVIVTSPNKSTNDKNVIFSV